MVDTLNILIVDNDPEQVQCLKRVFLSHGYGVVAARQCQEALSAAARHRFQAAVIDEDLPQVDGLELAQRLHAMFPDLPLVLTASTALPAGAQWPKCGVGKVVYKPYEAAQMLRMVKAAIAQRPAPSAAHAELRET